MSILNKISSTISSKISTKTQDGTNVNYNTSQISGFYHDLQKSNKLLSVTLHPSTIYNGSSWSNVTTGIGTGDVKYREEPLAVAILKEDFTIAIANNWTDFSGGDTLNQIWNSVRPFSAFAKYAADNLRKMQSTTNEMKEEGSDILESKAVQSITAAVSNALPYLDKGADYLNRSLVTQGSRFSYYGGTGTSFGNLSMKFIIFADWINQGNKKVFSTVKDQLSDLYPYIMGEYVNWDEKKAKDEGLNNFLGWQKPPGNFEADVKNIDNFVKGTLMLRFGGYYSIPNLVIRDAQLTFSKQMVKDPSNPNIISPLSCDVQLTLQPATKFSDKLLKEFVNGEFTGDDVKSINSELASKLQAIKDMNNNLLGK